MATGKRYYWIKLKESFMTSDTVDFLMSQTDGANYVVLYQMLCLKTINTGGRLSRTIGEVVIPYDVDKIQRDCKWFSADTIRVALSLYKRFGLIYEDVDGTLVLAQHDDLVGSETDWALQKRVQAQRNAAQLPPPASGDGVESGVENLHTDIRDIDTRDKRLDTRDRDKNQEIEDRDDVCAEPPDSGRSPQQAKSSKRTKKTRKPKEPEREPTPSAFDIMLVDGTTYNVPQENVDYYKRQFPGVDVEQQLRNMAAWSLNAGPKRKHRSGVKRFISNWLINEQNHATQRGPYSGNHRPVQNAPQVYDYGTDDDDPYKEWRNDNG